MTDYDLSDEHRLFRSTVREFAEGAIGPVAEELDREGRFPLDIVRQAAELGLLGIPIGAEWGGAGSDTLAYAIAIEELARVDQSFAITVAAHTSLGTMPIALFGSDEQKQRWLPPLASGERLAAFGLTEPGAGSDAGAARTTARLDGAEWVIDGSKMFITNAGTEITALVTITARTGEDEISNIVVENGTPGYELSPPLHKMGWRSSDTRGLSFTGCRVPEGHLLGPRGNGFRQLLQILDGGRISVAALGLGAAQGAFEMSLRYANEREQFGRPIGTFQAVAFKLADMATEIEAGRQLVYQAAWLKDSGCDFAHVAAMAKLYTGELSRRVCNEALQIHGGYGFMDEYPVSRVYRDQKVLEIGEGTNEVQRLVIARGLGLWARPPARQRAAAAGAGQGRDVRRGVAERRAPRAAAGDEPHPPGDRRRRVGPGRRRLRHRPLRHRPGRPHAGRGRHDAQARLPPRPREAGARHRPLTGVRPRTGPRCSFVTPSARGLTTFARNHDGRRRVQTLRESRSARGRCRRPLLLRVPWIGGTGADRVRGHLRAPDR